MDRVQKVILLAQDKLFQAWVKKNGRMPGIHSEEQEERGWAAWAKLDWALKNGEDPALDYDDDKNINMAMTHALCRWVKANDDKMPKKKSKNLIEKGLAFWREEMCRAKKSQTLKITKEDYEEISNNLEHYKDLLLFAINDGEEKPRNDTLMGKAFFLLTTKHVVIEYIDNY